MAITGSLMDIFYQWEYLGVFDILLPFLLIFAIVYGVLSSTKFMGDNRGGYVIIAFVIGLLSLRWQFFLSDFLSEIFPRLGIGLAVLLAVMILVGLFIAKEERKYWGWGLAALGFVIFLIVIFQSFERLGYYWSGYGSDSAGLIVLAVLLIGIIIAVAASGKEKHPGKDLGRGLADFLGWRD